MKQLVNEINGRVLPLTFSGSNEAITNWVREVEADSRREAEYLGAKLLKDYLGPTFSIKRIALLLHTGQFRHTRNPRKWLGFLVFYSKILSIFKKKNNI